MKTPTAVITAVLTLITIFFWVGFEVYRSFTVKPVPPVPAEVIKPLDPNLDIKTLNSLQQRMVITASTVPLATSTPIPSPTIIPLPSASPSATPTSKP